jgi:hypothetical protein
MKKRLVVVCLVLAALCAASCAQEGSFVIEGSVLIAYRASARAVTVPSCVTAIGDGAFRGCKGLTSISLSATLTGIGNWAVRLLRQSSQKR